MRLLVVPTLLVLSCAALAAEREVKTKIPDLDIEIALAIDGFKPDKIAEPGRTVLFGSTEHGEIVSVLWEENFPYLSSRECADEQVKKTNATLFAIDDVWACESKETLGKAAASVNFWAWHATPESLYTIHISTTLFGAAKNKQPFSRADFTRIVKSLREVGTPKPQKRSLPDEVYAFRDEAAAHAADQLAWVTAECDKRADAYAAHFYLGQLGMQQRNAELVTRGFLRACELLGQKPARTEQENRALLHGLDRAGGALAGEKKFKEALPLCERSIEVAQHLPSFKKFHQQALYNLSVCQAQSTQPQLALASLKRALQANPDFKQRAAKDELLQPLRSLKEFKALVGS